MHHAMVYFEPTFPRVSIDSSNESVKNRAMRVAKEMNRLVNEWVGGWVCEEPMKCVQPVEAMQLRLMCDDRMGAFSSTPIQVEQIALRTFASASFERLVLSQHIGASLSRHAGKVWRNDY